jgi:hypothetical protein
MKTTFVALLAAVAALSCRPALADIPDGVAATYVVDKFYRTCLKIDPIGFPTVSQMKRLAPIFSRDLNEMIAQARGTQRALVRLDRETSGNWRTANVFTSLPAGFDYYGIGLAVIQGDIATVPVHLEHHHQGRIVRWLDVVVLERHGSGRNWRVVDIYLNAPFAFANGASLRARLHDLITPPASPVPLEALPPVNVPVPSGAPQPILLPPAPPKLIPPAKDTLRTDPVALRASAPAPAPAPGLAADITVRRAVVP